MSQTPIVLVLLDQEFGSSDDLIKNITKIDTNSQAITMQANPELKAYTLHLSNKYFKKEIYLIPFTNDLITLPPNILAATEGVLIYFNSKDKTFKTRLSSYAEFLKNNKIELGILICDKLYDNSNDGITYFEAKQEFKVLDVIELNKNVVDESGYEELYEILNNFIWSNVNISEHSTNVNLSTIGCEEDDILARNTGSDDVETEMRNFEKLLMAMMNFKNTSSTLSHEQRLHHAEKIAEKFEKLLEDYSSEEETEKPT